MKITKADAIRIFEQATDKDDPAWEHATEDFYDEENDEIPTIMDVFSALGVTRDEYTEATNNHEVVWPGEEMPADMPYP